MPGLYMGSRNSIRVRSKCIIFEGVDCNLFIWQFGFRRNPAFSLFVFLWLDSGHQHDQKNIAAIYLIPV
jgi:hypothetical protein